METIVSTITNESPSATLVLEAARENVPERNPTITRIFMKIEALDFTELGAKLMLHDPEGYGWSEEQTRAAEQAYKLFLKLHALHPEHRNSPSIPVDLFWHAHILDTRRYAIDCQEIFGHFLHHFPYFGLRGDRDQLQSAFKETNELYQKEFGACPALELAIAGHPMDCCDPCTTENL